MTAGLPSHLRQLADDSAQRWADLMADQPRVPSESFILEFKRTSRMEQAMRQAADEIDRLRKALETIAGQYELATDTHARSLAWTAIEALK